MNSEQVDSFAYRNKFVRRHYEGCFASDTLPQVEVTKTPRLFCVNLCESTITNDSSCHWIAINIRHNIVEFFDSGGDKSYTSNRGISDFLLRQQKPIIYNKTPIQSSSSDKCGAFVLCFLHSTAINIKFESFINFFDKTNLNLNDTIVWKLFKYIYLRKSNLNYSMYE